jgi:tetratricopeptide (TPR) repeat protein
VTALPLLLLLAGGPGTAPLLVVPPQPEANTTDAAWIGEVVSDLLPQSLAQAGVATVDRGDRLRAQEALEIAHGPLTRATSVRVAEAMEASRVLTGTFSLQGTSLTLSLRILDLERGTLSAPFVIAGPRESLADLTHVLAWDIALAAGPPPPITRDEYLARRSAAPFEAIEAYGRALTAPDAEAEGRLLAKALQVHPAYHQARLTLGRLQLQAREFDEAIETLGHVPAEAPQARAARFLQGVALLQVGRYRESAGVFAELVAGDPTPAALNNHALALLRTTGRTTDVRPSQVLRKALELEPGSNDLAFNLGWALLWEDDLASAEQQLRAVLQQDPLDSHARAVLVWTLRKAGREGEAQEEWKAVLALSPSYESLRLPDPSRRFERIRVAERALAEDRGSRTGAEVVAGLMGRAERLSAAGDHAGAARELSRAVYLDPYAPRIHVLLARAHRAAGDHEKALAELRMALWPREDAAVRAELAVLLHEMGRKEEARAEAEKVLKLEPQNDAARKVLASTR